MSKYRIHRVTDKDKAFNDLLDEAGYDYEDQAVYCLTDKKGKLYCSTCLYFQLQQRCKGYPQ